MRIEVLIVTTVRVLWSIEHMPLAPVLWRFSVLQTSALVAARTANTGRALAESRPAAQYV